jgi:hypothetical protein
MKYYFQGNGTLINRKNYALKYFYFMSVKRV